MGENSEMLCTIGKARGEACPPRFSPPSEGFVRAFKAKEKLGKFEVLNFLGNAVHGCFLLICK